MSSWMNSAAGQPHRRECDLKVGGAVLRAVFDRDDRSHTEDRDRDLGILKRIPDPSLKRIPDPSLDPLRRGPLPDAHAALLSAVVWWPRWSR